MRKKLLFSLPTRVKAGQMRKNLLLLLLLLLLEALLLQFSPDARQRWWEGEVRDHQLRHHHGKDDGQTVAATPPPWDQASFR